VAPEVKTDDTGRRHDDAVRRLRDESRRRIERGRVAGMSSCILGTMVAMLLFVALEARRMYWIGTAIDASARGAAACEQFGRRQLEIDAATRELRASAFDAEQVRLIEAHVGEELATARRFALAAGCEAAALPPAPAPVLRDEIRGEGEPFVCGANRPPAPPHLKRVK
jgi:hypothetical protein